MNPSNELSLEQQFNLRIFADYVERMSREQAQEFLIKLHKQMMLKDNLYKNLLKQDWGIDSDSFVV